MTTTLVLGAFALGVAAGLLMAIQVIALHDQPQDDWLCAE